MKKRLLPLLVVILLLTSCGVYNSIMNLSKLQYKLDSVDNFRIGNLLISNKSRLSDFNTIDLTKLISQVASGNLPVTFVLNVLAKNPNKNTTANTSDITLESFPWTLYIDGVKTVSGNISQPVKVPSVKTSTVIPLQISLNIMDFFKEKNLNEVLDLALSIGGQKGTSSKIKIVAEPTLGTPLGKMTYPSPITIVEKSFN